MRNFVNKNGCGGDETPRRGGNKLFACAAFCLPILFLAFSIFSSSVYSQEIRLKSKFQTGDFKLADKNQTADVIISPDDYKVVNIAANDFASDVERVTGKKPLVKYEAQKSSENQVIIGTLGKSKIVDELIKSGKLDVSKIRNKWESFLIATIKKPFRACSRGRRKPSSRRRAISDRKLTRKSLNCFCV